MSDDLPDPLMETARKIRAGFEAAEVIEGEVAPAETDAPFYTPEELARRGRPQPKTLRAPHPIDRDTGVQADRHCLVVKLARLLPNDTDNGARLIAWFDGEILFVRGVGWHVWTGTHWDREGADDALMRMAQETARRIAWEAKVLDAPELHDAIERAKMLAELEENERSATQNDAIEDGEEAETLLDKLRGARRKFSVSCGNAARLANMIEQARAHCSVSIEAMDADPLLLNCRNGTLRFIQVDDLETPQGVPMRKTWDVEFLPHNPAHRISRRIEADYDPDAQHPLLDAFLKRFQPSRGVQSFLQDFHGYALVGQGNAQMVAFYYGEGSNGKSTFIEMISQLMGRYSKPLNNESITGEAVRGAGQATPDLAQLPGARMVRVSELADGVPLKEALVKSLTGGEPMQVRHLNRDFFEYRPNFAPLMSGNHKPRISGVDLGIWRRMALVIWENTISHDEKRPMSEVLKEFEAEASGLLNWLITGALTYLKTGRLHLPAEVLEATAEYRQDMDPVQRFIDACVRREPDTMRVQSRALFEAYCNWSAANGLKNYHETRFSLTMQKKGFRKEEGRIRHFIGLRLEDVPPAPMRFDERDRGDWTRNPRDEA
jgi:putative DNA primase/helicase